MTLRNHEKRYKVKLTLTREMLGTAPIGDQSDTSIYEDYILATAPDPDAARGELETLPTWDIVQDDDMPFDEEVEAALEGEDNKRGWTGFHMIENDGVMIPIIYDYMVKGHLKSACKYLRRIKGRGGTASAKLRAYIKKITGGLFIEPRRIRLQIPDGELMGVNIRPLRANTPRGERTALARSLTVPAGTTMQITIVVLGGDKVIPQDALEEWLDYGRYSGLGQWRNAGYGRFNYTLNVVE